MSVKRAESVFLEINAVKEAVSIRPEGRKGTAFLQCMKVILNISIGLYD